MYIGGKDYQVSFVKNKNSNIKNYLYINGRIAFKNILDVIKKNKKKIINCPNYICDSLLKVIDKKHYKIKFYNVYDDLSLDIPDVKNELILVIDYFGKQSKISKEIIKKNIIIHDKTHSFINEKKIKIIKRKNYFFFSSIRKSFPSAVLGVSNLKNNKKKVFSSKLENIYFKCISSAYLKEEYIKKVNYLKDNKIEQIYLKNFEELENFFDKSDENINFSKILNYSKFSNNFYHHRKILKKNIQFLVKKISPKITNLAKSKDAIYFVMNVKNKNNFITFLRKFNIYISNYWSRPSLIKNKKLSHNLFEKIIVLPNSVYLKKSNLIHLANKINFYYKKNEI